MVNGVYLRSAHGSWKTGVLPLMLAAYLLTCTFGELLQARVELHALQERMRKAESSKANKAKGAPARSSSSKHVHHE